MSIRRAFCSRHSGAREARARNPYAVTDLVAKIGQRLSLKQRWPVVMDSGPAPRGASRNDETKKPAVIGDGRLSSARKFPCGFTLRNAYRNVWLSEIGARYRARRSDDLGGDVADAGASQADRARGGGGEVEHAPLDEGTAVIDGHDDALAPMGHAQLGAERQRAVGAGQRVLVEALAGGRLAAGLVAVERGNAREAAAGARRRRDSGIGVPPVRLRARPVLLAT